MAEIEAPSGLDLHPEPPSTVRVSKRAGMLGISLFVLVAGLLLYGMYARQQKQIRATETNGENKKPSPATQAAEEVKSAMAPAVSRVADHRGAGGSSTPELKPPAREDRSSAPNARSELAGYSQYQ